MKGRNFKRRGFCFFHSKKAVEEKTKPKLIAKKKTMTVGETYKLKLKGVPGKAKGKQHYSILRLHFSLTNNRIGHIIVLNRTIRKRET